MRLLQSCGGRDFEAQLQASTKRVDGALAQVVRVVDVNATLRKRLEDTEKIQSITLTKERAKVKAVEKDDDAVSALQKELAEERAKSNILGEKLAPFVAATAPLTRFRPME